MAEFPAAHIGVDHERPSAGKGQRDGKVGRNGRLAFIGQGARDDQGFGARALHREKDQRGAETPKPLQKSQPVVVRAKQGGLRLKFIPGNLPQNRLGELGLKFDEGADAVVELIDAKENRQADQKAAPETGQNNFDPARLDRLPRGGLIQDGNRLLIDVFGHIQAGPIAQQTLVLFLGVIRLRLDFIEFGNATA